MTRVIETDLAIVDNSHFYWSKAFPLYGRNYDSVLRAIEKMERDLPGLFYAGNLSFACTIEFF